MSDKTVTVAQTSGTTVVVNNKRDGMRKWSIALAMFLASAIINQVRVQFPQYGEFLEGILRIAEGAGLFGAGMVLTSPFDKRGVVLNQDGSVEVGITPPTGPAGPNFLRSILAALAIISGLLLASGTLTGCAKFKKLLPPGQTLDVTVNGVRLRTDDTGTTVSQLPPEIYFPHNKLYYEEPAPPQLAK